MHHGHLVCSLTVASLLCAACVRNSESELHPIHNRADPESRAYSCQRCKYNTLSESWVVTLDTDMPPSITQPMSP